MRNGHALTEWGDEQLSSGFDTTRHPRTMIGVDAQDAIWLVTVDGRQPTVSLGMSFAELQGLCRRLGLKSSLNLDGGGSTTMVVRGNVVNHPSDPAGPRAVSDAILVFARKRP
jgi:exopolysaccharide biosynthesis protein